MKKRYGISIAYQSEDKLQCSPTRLPWQYCMARRYVTHYHYGRELMCVNSNFLLLLRQRLTWMVHWSCQVGKMLKQSFQHWVSYCTHDDPPMIHENKMQPDFHIDLWYAIVRDSLLEVHRLGRGSQTEMGAHSSAGKRQHNDCPTT